MNPCLVIQPGMLDFQAAYGLQRRLHGLVAGGELPDTLLLLEHPHIYTLGRRGRRADILVDDDALRRLGVEMYVTDRGGETTYHGPGQLVGYPIVDLRRWGGGVRRYVETLERALIGALAEYGIAAHSDGKPTGVWVADAKIAAIGVRVSRHVTMHGFALNVCPDLSFFDHIVPCGMADGRVTSMAQEIGREVAVADAAQAMTQAFGRAFGISVEWSSLSAIEEGAGTSLC